MCHMLCAEDTTNTASAATTVGNGVADAPEHVELQVLHGSLARSCTLSHMVHKLLWKVKYGRAHGHGIAHSYCAPVARHSLAQQGGTDSDQTSSPEEQILHLQEDLKSTMNLT